MTRAANISPKLKARMEEVGLKDLKALAAVSKVPYVTLCELIVGHRHWKLNHALAVLDALRRPQFSRTITEMAEDEKDTLMRELADLFTCKSDRV